MDPREHLRLAVRDTEFTRAQLRRSAENTKKAVKDHYPSALSELEAETERLKLGVSSEKVEEPAIVGGFGSLTAAQVENLKRKFDGRMNKNV